MMRIVVQSWKLVTVVLLCIGAVGGCASTAGLPPVDSPNGFAMELFVAQPGDRYARFRVDPDRTLHFAGGAGAVQGDEFAWSGELSGEDARALRAMIEDAEWLHRVPPSSGEPRDLRYELAVRTWSAANAFRVHGENGGLAALHELLSRAAQVRFQPILDALPQAGDPVR